MASTHTRRMAPTILGILAAAIGLAACEGKITPAVPTAHGPQTAPSKYEQEVAAAAAQLKGKTPAEAIELMCNELLPTQKSDLSFQGWNPPPKCPSGNCNTKVAITMVAGSHCVASWDYQGYEVEKGEKGVVLSWTLDDRSGVKDGFQFDPTYGIGLCPQSTNHPAKDIDTGNARTGCTASCQTFTHVSANQRPRLRTDNQPPHGDKNLDGSDVPDASRAAVHFGIAVVNQRTKQVCVSRDPVIINRGL